METFQDFITTFPMVIVPIVFWLAYRQFSSEKELKSEMSQQRVDIAEIKTDIKWLVEKHKANE